jgi:hypothetical protein
MPEKQKEYTYRNSCALAACIAQWQFLNPKIVHHDLWIPTRPIGHRARQLQREHNPMRRDSSTGNDKDLKIENDLVTRKIHRTLTTLVALLSSS